MLCLDSEKNPIEEDFYLYAHRRQICYVEKSRKVRGHWTEKYDWILHTNGSTSGLTPKFALELFRLYDDVDNHLKSLEEQAKIQPKFVALIRENILKQKSSQSQPKCTKNSLRDIEYLAEGPVLR